MVSSNIVSWLSGLLVFFGASYCVAQSFPVLFVDQHNQPLEFAVAVDPLAPKVRSVANKQPAIIDQVNMQFSPRVIAIEKGREVVFPNSDNIQHHVYSFSKAKRFETKLYANKPDSSVVFDQSGLVVLGCNIHDSMIGYIFVTDSTGFGVSDAQGKAFIESPKRPSTVTYWHPWSTTPNKLQTLTVDQWPKGKALTITLTISPPIVESSPLEKRFGNRW